LYGSSKKLVVIYTEHIISADKWNENRDIKKNIEKMFEYLKKNKKEKLPLSHLLSVYENTCPH